MGTSQIALRPSGALPLSRADWRGGLLVSLPESRRSRPAALGREYAFDRRSRATVSDRPKMYRRARSPKSRLSKSWGMCCPLYFAVT
jgi:hypothetical protein